MMTKRTVTPEEQELINDVDWLSAQFERITNGLTAAHVQTGGHAINIKHLNEARDHAKQSIKHLLAAIHNEK
ncbi:hypothetical protein D0812_22120 [Vibrio owensii]|uniref:Uncharacterized protein n=1 Tax=Vibrio owensii TaxID=696485 RepID=A0AAP9GFG9_9VIBR|nr:hypothetical protein [Vibrio owensii]AYO17088.1 hypothetical protein D0812_22120 [Vibrio owensii]QGH49233.1 hypothetical protein APZ19_19130 [Vibrio owensii]